MRNTVNPIIVLNQLASKISYDKPQKSYKWELGEQVMKDIITLMNLVEPDEEIKPISSIYGWPVELSKDTNCIKLWENIQC